MTSFGKCLQVVMRPCSVTKCLASVEVWYLGTSIYLHCQYCCIMHIAFHTKKICVLEKSKGFTL